ncbi:MAG: hypothetical protein ABH879_00850 [archaeon]
MPEITGDNMYAGTLMEKGRAAYQKGTEYLDSAVMRLAERTNAFMEATGLAKIVDAIDEKVGSITGKVSPGLVYLRDPDGSQQIGYQPGYDAPGIMYAKGRTTSSRKGQGESEQTQRQFTSRRKEKAHRRREAAEHASHLKKVLREKVQAGAPIDESLIKQARQYGIKARDVGAHW